MTCTNKLSSTKTNVIEVEVDLLDGGEDGEHNGVGFVEISMLSAMQADHIWLSLEKCQCLCQYNYSKSSY